MYHPLSQLKYPSWEGGVRAGAVGWGQTLKNITYMSAINFTAYNRLFYNFF